MSELLETIRGRKSVRTFDGKPLREADRERLEQYIATIGNPFGIPVRFVLLDAAKHGLSSPVLSGETLYVAAKVARVPHAEAALGYMPAAVLVHVINRIVFPPKGKEMSLKEIVLEARDTTAEVFKADPHIGELTDIIDRAVLLSENDVDDLDNIHQLGEGWTGEETLGISLYCALKYHDDFSAGIIASVNHRGDSDSTGAVTGNILGALLGYHAIADQWKKDLELSDTGKTASRI